MDKLSALKNPKIVMVGGGSVNWSPKLINDLTLTPGLENALYVILDKDPAAGSQMVLLGRKLAGARGLSCSFEFTDSQEEAFPGADFILITISTGGLDAMEADIAIPERYNIFHTVGDTVGPAGWARGLRNIDVFARMAKNIEKYSPGAIVMNYTNPMAVLTNVFYKVSGLKAIGLCHSPFDNYLAMAKIFALDSMDGLELTFGGTNHFFWITDMKINGEDGYQLLKEKMKDLSFADLIPEDRLQEYGFYSGMRLCSELFDHYGFLPYVGDRHICEFVHGYITGDESKLQRYKLVRTPVEARRKYIREAGLLLGQYMNDTEKLPDQRSAEIASGIIEACISGRTLTDVVNLPNAGQIKNLPEGSIVETLGKIGPKGFEPLEVGDLPEPVLNLVLPHVRNQNLIVEAGLEGSLDKALWALHNDPLCSHLTLGEIKEMGMALLKAHEQHLPQFKL